MIHPTDPHPGEPSWSRPRSYRTGRNRPWPWLIALAVSIAVALAGMAVAAGGQHGTGPARPLSATTQIPWPSYGQSAVMVVGVGMIGTSGSEEPVPIASLAKMMTAYVILRDHPDIDGDAEGGSVLDLVVTNAIVRDTQARRERGESVVAVRAGERLSERQALAAILLPSANNIAVALAERDTGSVARFVAKMNRTARHLGLSSTRYTDPSGYDAGTVSTARDQLRLTAVVMAVKAFARLVGSSVADIPVAGRIRNTNPLLGHGGFIGTKTGSDSAAGGCLAFTRVQRMKGRTVTTFGVVLGQRGGALIPSAVAAARRLVDAVDAARMR